RKGSRVRVPRRAVRPRNRALPEETRQRVSSKPRFAGRPEVPAEEIQGPDYQQRLHSAVAGPGYRSDAWERLADSGPARPDGLTGPKQSGHRAAADDGHDAHDTFPRGHRDTRRGSDGRHHGRGEQEQGHIHSPLQGPQPLQRVGVRLHSASASASAWRRRHAGCSRGTRWPRRHANSGRKTRRTRHRWTRRPRRTRRTGRTGWPNWTWRSEWTRRSWSGRESVSADLPTASSWSLG